jgi:hypothetical protein
MTGLFGLVKPFVSDANQLITLLGILGISGNTVVHAYGDREFERAKKIGEDHADTAAERGGLCGVSLRKEQCEFVAPNPERGIGGAQGFLKSCRGGPQHLIAARMTVLVVDFLEAMKVESHQAQGMRVATSTVQFLVEGFIEEAAVIKAGERIGDCAAMNAFKVVVFQHDGHAKQAGCDENIDEGSLKRDGRLATFGKMSLARENVIPEREHPVLRNFDMREGQEKTLKKLCACARLKTVERVCNEFKIGVGRTHARGYRNAGAGDHRCGPNLTCPRGEMGRCDYSARGVEQTGCQARKRGARSKTHSFATESAGNNNTRKALIEGQKKRDWIATSWRKRDLS